MTSNVQWENTSSLYEYVSQRAKAFPSKRDFLGNVAENLDEVWADNVLPVEPLKHAYRIVAKLYEQELQDITPPDFHEHLIDTLEGARYRDQLLSLLPRLSDHCVPLMSRAFATLIIRFFDTLPPSCYQDTPHSFNVRLIDQAKNVPEFVEAVIGELGKLTCPYFEVLLSLRRQFAANIEAVKGRTPTELKATPSEVVEAYFHNTPLISLFDINIPFGIPEHVRYHTAIIAKTRWGKSQLLQTLILEELQKPEPSSVIVLDSTGQMTDLIQKLAVFNDTLKSRLLIIDPAHSPALNMFDMSNARLQTYTPEMREELESEIVTLFNYIFSSNKYDLTAQMGTAFSYAIKLVFSMQGKGVTLNTLRKVLEEKPKGGLEGSEFREDIMAMDANTIDFFASHFYATAYAQTKAQIARRIHQLIVIPAFARMFTAATNILDIHADTQDRAAIILVNTNEALLKEDSYVLFGRYIIARIVASMMERSAIAEKDRRVTHLIIDEAAPYFDETFDTLLTRVGKYKLKVTVAFQHFDQLTDKMRNAVSGQTSVKYIGGLSSTDERRIANEIRCDTEFLSDLDRDSGNPPKWADFAVYADGLTKRAVKIRLPFFKMEQQPMMTAEQHAAMLQRNKARVVPPLSPGERTVAPPFAPQPKRTVSVEQPPNAPSPADDPERGSTW